MATRLSSPVAGLLTIVLAGTLSACSQPEQPSSPPPSSSRPATVGPSSPSGLPDTSQQPTPSTTGSQPADPEANEITVTGRIESGVEPGCLVLHAPDRAYLLVGGDRERLAGGGQLTVRGRLEPGLMTTCQQGTPLRVLEVSAP